MRRLRSLWFLVLVAMPAAAVAQEKPVARIAPPTPETCYWTDRAFPEMPAPTPAAASGIVLWSHGQEGSGKPGWLNGAPPVIRLFAERGFDVRLALRNPRCEGSWAQKGAEYVEAVAAEARRARAEGWRRILVAGQSYGAGTALGAGGTDAPIDGVLAFALSHGRGSCREPARFKPAMIGEHTRYIRDAIAAVRSPRVLISMGKDDHCVGHSFTPLVEGGLAARPVAYIHLDEAMSFSGHGAALSNRFAKAYGECILAFFTTEPPPPPGRRICTE